MASLPGIYIPGDDESVEARYRGIGVRIEGDFLATQGGYVHLSRHIPRTVEEIERAMNDGNQLRGERRLGISL